MYKIDKKTAEDIEERIESLAKEFTPEWQFSRVNPDIGSTISRIYARQLQDNIKILNQVPGIYHAAFVNILDLTLRRATPAGSVVLFKLVDSAVGGTYVPAGTLVSSGGPGEDGESEVLFATERDIFITPSALTDVFLTDRELGSIIPLKGEFTAPALYDEPESPIEPEGEEEDHNALKPFVLFHEDESASISRFMLGIYHSSVFDVDEEPIFIKIEGGSEVVSRIASGELKFMWLSEDGLKEFDDMYITSEGSFRLKKSGTFRKLGEDTSGKESLVVLKATHPIKDVLEISDIKLSSEGAGKSPEYVGDGEGEFEVASFAPFGDSLNLYAECYIGVKSYFDKPGSRVTLRFNLSMAENLLDLTREQEISELKVVKKKQSMIRESAVADVFCDEISIEYFNGIGWKTLKCEKEYKALFAGETGGKHELSFTCPSDWAATETGAFEGRVLRVRLLRCDNCFERPSMHHYPVIKDLRVSYSYEGREARPEHLKSLAGSRITDLSDKARGGRKYTILMPSEYLDDSLYLGFDAQMESGPIGLFFNLQGGVGQNGIQCRMEYATNRGFRQMKIIDGTEGFCHSGIIVFMPPPDFTPMTLEGKRKYWLRIVRDENQGRESVNFMTHIEDISINAVSVVNAVVSPEEDFFIDEVVSGYKTSLGSDKILDADVWVNEKGVLLGDELNRLSKEHPDDIRIEYDNVGNVSSCFVHWHETEYFPDRNDIDDRKRTWDQARCYRLDRLTGEIIFGDGIRSEIPRVTDDVAFRARIRTCRGEAANVPENTLTSLPENIMFVDHITNPVRAYGGSNMETVSSALRRGADMIFSHGRLVSAVDYEHAALRFSGVIDKVSVIPGITKDGREDPSELSLVLLMKDYKEGSFSFHRIEPKLRSYLTSSCELSVLPEKLHVTEPVFVYVSVSVWTEVMNLDESFEVQNVIRDTLERYLDPVNGGGEAGRGFTIGTMPKKPQIMMQLAGIKKQAQIRKTSITVHYTDFDGEHESDYDSLVVTPFMVARSGVHQVNILYDRSELDAQD